MKHAQLLNNLQCFIAYWWIYTLSIIYVRILPQGLHNFYLGFWWWPWGSIGWSCGAATTMWNINQNCQTFLMGKDWNYVLRKIHITETNSPCWMSFEETSRMGSTSIVSSRKQEPKQILRFVVQFDFNVCACHNLNKLRNLLGIVWVEIGKIGRFGMRGPRPGMLTPNWPEL